jgi:hypothetical protein
MKLITKICFDGADCIQLAKYEFLLLIITKTDIRFPYLALVLDIIH